MEAREECFKELRDNYVSWIMKEKNEDRKTSIKFSKIKVIGDLS